MFGCKGFSLGLMAGAALGIMAVVAMEPMKEKGVKRFKKSAGEMIHSVGDMLEGNTSN